MFANRNWEQSKSLESLGDKGQIRNSTSSTGWIVCDRGIVGPLEPPVLALSASCADLSLIRCFHSLHSLPLCSHDHLREGRDLYCRRPACGWNGDYQQTPCLSLQREGQRGPMLYHCRKCATSSLVRTNQFRNGKAVM